MFSHVENTYLAHLTGDSHHPYTKGKLCAKGFSLLEKNKRHDRLKSPYYQEIKGSGRFKKITWKKAYELITSEMLNIHKQYGNFLPLALYKGTGNTGIHHYVTDEFFSSLGKTTRALSSTLKDTIPWGTGSFQMCNPVLIKESSLILIWGANPAATNIHLIPLLIEAKVKGAKIIVIDPVYTQTAELADLYIQLIPGTDGTLARILAKSLLESDLIDKEFIKEYSNGFDSFVKEIQGIDSDKTLLQCGVSKDAIDIIISWFHTEGAVSHLLGAGPRKHSNSQQAICAVEALAAIHGDIGKRGGGIFSWNKEFPLFNNQRYGESDAKNRYILLHQELELSTKSDPPIEMLWITSGNPITQYPDADSVRQFIQDIPFVVTVEHFMTPTAQMSNLVLPTTTLFEQLDIVVNCWHKEVTLNEKAIPPFHESRSEWMIMKELAERLNEYDTELSSFPIHSSEEEYLNAQFNDSVSERYNINSLGELKERTMFLYQPVMTRENLKFTTESGKFQFCSTEANSLPYKKADIARISPSEDYPFWLITAHHPYRMNSQFHYLNLRDEDEDCIVINPVAAKRKKIFDGEVIRVFNERAEVEIKAKYSDKVPKDILFIYQSWYPHSKVVINQLIPTHSNDNINTDFAFYDTFVNVEKL
jgi:anaerobic selenocysteine-containing dehydrogenase